jgi:hypothetical protein
VANVPEVADDEVLWRRAMPFDLKPDGTANSNLWRSKEVSVHRASMTSLPTVTAASGCAAVFAITAKELRDLGLTVMSKIEEGDTDDHAVVIGVTNSGKAQKIRDKAKKVWSAT